MRRAEKPAHSPQYQWYGAKGIEIRIKKQWFCELWQLAVSCEICRDPFVSGRGSFSKTTDRIDPDGHYEEKNIRFIQKRFNVGLRNTFSSKKS